MSAQDQVIKEAKDIVKNAVKSSYKGETQTGFSKVINGIMNNGFGGLEAAGRILGGEGISNSLVKTFGRNVVQEGEKFVAKDGYNYGKIAGSYLGVAVAGRVLSGGGVYKDGQGNTNLVGIPFV